MMIQSDNNITIPGAGGVPGSHCSVWVRGADGIIGHFEAANAESAKLLLDEACQKLKEEGCARVIGPMDENTWHRYRFVTYSDGSAPFLLEPSNPPEYPEWFTENGFVPLAGYYSKRGKMTDNFDRSDALKASLTEEGFLFRPLAMEHLEEELGLLYEVAGPAFRDNLFYETISREAFVAQYLQYRSFLIPELIQLAFYGNSPVGFMFIVPDYNETAGLAGGPLPKTAIAKTIAVLQEYRNKRIGSVVLNEAYKAARDMGMTEVITALVYDENVSGKLIQDDYTCFRRYTLFKKDLDRVRGEQEQSE